MPTSSIFLSYARKDDQDFVQRLYHDLNRLGFDVWWDLVSMPSRDLTFLQEIRDAINRVDRLLLVVGPHAVTSDYVRAEWEYAREICTPVNPILRIGDFDLLPDDLKNLDTRDFRDDSHYADQLDRLITQLREDIPPLGRLINVPALPPRYLPRPDHLAAIGEHVLGDINAPTVITAERKTTAVQGMGGIGKTVIATAFAYACTTRRAFSDGIVWVKVGRRADQRALYEVAGVGLGDTPQNYREEVAAKANLQKMLTGKTCLIVLDDVWKMEHAALFRDLIADGRSRLLITTRDGGLAARLGAQEHALDLLRDDQALALLAEWADLPIDDLPEESPDVMRECGNLPLALAMIGATVRGKSDRWRYVLHRLRTADVGKIRQRFPNYPYENVLSAIQVSVDDLKPDHRARYLDFAVFREDTRIPETAVITLWESFGLDEFDTVEVLDDLIARSLMRREGDGRLVLHDLQVDYVSNTAVRQDSGVESVSTLHERLLAAYHVKCSNGWHTGPNDGYFFEHLAYHLHESGRHTELYTLLTESALDGDPNPWMEAKFIRLGGDTAYVADLELAIGDFSDPLTAQPLLWLVKLWAAKQSVHARVLNYGVDDLRILLLIDLNIEKNGSRTNEAFSVAYLQPDNADRFHMLMTLFRELKKHDKSVSNLLDQALNTAPGIEAHLFGFTSSEALYEVAEGMAQIGRIEDAFSVARSITDHYRRAMALAALVSALVRLGDHRAEMTFREALEIAHNIKDSRLRADALREIAVELNDIQNDWTNAAFDEALSLARRIENSEIRAHTLREIAAALAQTRHFDKGLNIARGIEYYNDRSWALHEVAVALAQAGNFDKALSIGQQIERAYWKIKALHTIAISLAQAEDKRADVIFCEILSIAYDISESEDDYGGLAGTAIALAHAGRVDKALSIARSIEGVRQGNGVEISVLSDVAVALAEAGYFDEALDIVLPGQDVNALRAIAALLALKADRRAVAVFSDVRRSASHTRFDLDFKGHAYAEGDVAAALAQVGCFEAALQVARNMGHPGIQANIAISLAKAGGTNEALSLASDNTDQTESSRILYHTIMALSNAGRLEEALGVARSIEDGRWRAISLCRLGVEFAKIGLKQNRRIFKEALKVVNGVKEPYQRDSAVDTIVKALAECRFFDKALNAARSIKDVGKRASALTHIAVEMTKAEDNRAITTFDEGLAGTRIIEKPSERAEALASFALEVTRIQRGRESSIYKEALDVIWRIENTDQRDQLLYKIAMAMIENNNIAEALDVGKAIQNAFWHAGVLSTIALKFAKDGKEQADAIFDEALNLARNIEDTDLRTYALRHTAVQMTQVGRKRAIAVFDEAFDVASFTSGYIDGLNLRLLNTVELLAEAGHLAGKSGVFSILGTRKPPEFLQGIARCASGIEQVEKGLFSAAIRECVRILAWSSLWEDFYKLLQTSTDNCIEN